MKKNVMKIRVLSREEFQKRTIAIAKGEIKPKEDDPKVFFESMESIGQVLSGQNQELLTLMFQKPRGPQVQGVQD